ncbi:AAA domain-containing protein [Clostridium sp. J1101437_171009_A5]|uniref:AAA domain-containing protein n=1 Tax=Clostridium sp. J1101437_171009_A5 TaxID=2787098 RepID=UPI002570970A|nr:AAA domain-containing protein [Clostridium sp. J1101437_171009_A5]
MFLINGQDKTDSVASFRFQDGMCEVVYSSSPKPYHYRSEKVQLLEVQSRIDPTQFIITVDGNPFSQIDEILDFGSFYRFIRTGKRALTYPKGQVELQKNCLTSQRQAGVFEYFKETAAAVSLVAEDGRNILNAQYERIQSVSDATVLSCYLDSSKEPAVRALPEAVIYPFGLNQSQKTAVENALSSQISIIQGPPGTGKTQTILNIIANAVRNGQTVAVVSNNNSATLNVAEKLEKKGLSFLAAFLGSRANKEHFLEAQTGQYPDMSAWALEAEEEAQLNQEITVLSKELSEMLNAKNRIAAIEQELLQLTPEQHYFSEYYSTYAKGLRDEVKGLSSREILSLWLEYEQHAQQESMWASLLQKIAILLRFNRSALRVFFKAPELVIPYLQRQFYMVRQQELTEERVQLEKKLERYAFDEKMAELTEKSLRLFRAELSEKFPWEEPRRCFEMRDFRGKSRELNREYPVILSTTYSIKGTLNFEHTYDYLIVDEASQVDLATGVLAFASAKNIVIVGDLQQLPNVLDNQNIQKSEKIWGRYSLPETYHFTAHSLLSSAIATWPEAPTVLLREHYRCHPKIINFCNQKFYGGKLIVMTEDHEEPDVLTMYRTAPGNHARGHLNQRQIDVIRQEVLPSLERQGYGSIGIITPYRDQVAAIQTQLGKELEVATVHKFQGREKDAIVLTSVDNVITDFVDDPRMLNVAVSRAVKSLTVITSQDPQNDRTNYGDLARYIEYNNCAVIESAVYSVFDLLYQGYAEQRRAFLKKHGRVSEYDSENLVYAVIQNMLQKAEFSFVDCAAHVSLVNLVKDYSMLTEEETAYARNPLSHVDFLLFRRMDKSPLLAVEVDGAAFHAAGSVQADRDEKKNRIFEQCNIPLLRLRTDGSGEEERIEQALRSAVSNS